MSYYGGVYDANIYWALKLGSEPWDAADDTKKEKALVTATQLIDRLNFRGQKSEDDQDLQFPRFDDTEVPTVIVESCYEIANVLLGGVDLDTLLGNLSITSNRYGPVSTTYDRRVVPEHLIAGIPSALAWSWLRPYLVNPRDVLISRVS